MKRRIAIEQLNELTDIQKSRLRELWEPKEGDYKVNILTEKQYVDIVRNTESIIDYKNDYLPLLDIGQMIEIMINTKGESETGILLEQILGDISYDVNEGKCLCDSLFEEVKQII